MSEIITIREAAGRLGTSDTSIRKAIEAGRITVAETDAKGRKLLAWPACEAEYHANSDVSKRSHKGSRGSARREKYSAGAGDVVDAPAEPVESDADLPMTYAEARARHERFKARLAELELEQAEGKLVAADGVRKEAFRVARIVRDALLNIPDRVAGELAAETNQFKVHQRLVSEIRRALEDLKIE